LNIKKTDITLEKNKYTNTMSFSTTNKSFLNQDDILEEINRLKFMIDNLKKEKADITGKPLSHKRKYDLITDDVEYESYNSDEEYVEEFVKYSKLC